MPKKDAFILYIGGFELPDKNAAAHRVLNNAKILREQGEKVIFVGIDKNLPYNSNIIDTQSDVQGFCSYAVPYPKGKKQWIDYLTAINRYIELIDYLGDIKAIILYNFQSVAMRKIIDYCEKKGIKCLADVTEWRTAKGEDFVYRILKESDTWYRMHILHRKMDGLIVISRYLEKYYQDCKNVTYIPALTDLSEKKWENPYKKSEGILYLVYAGNPGFKDKINVLIEALMRVERQYCLDVIGISLEQYLDRNPQHTSFLAGNEKIVFHGQLSHIEALEYVKKANYSCFFRDDDRVSKSGFPTKFAEAISCGTPVLSNRTSNLEEYIEDDKNGILINDISPDNIKKSLERCPYKLQVQSDCFDFRQFIKLLDMYEMLNND